MDNQRTIDPMDDRIVQTIANMNERLGNLERTTQPQLIDWYDYNPALFSYGSADKINITGMNATRFFQIGDKIRIKQSSVYIFLLITLVASSYIYVSATTTDRLANSSIEQISTSRLENPSSFTLDEDWQDSSPAFYTYSNANKISVSQIDPRNYISIGDKIRLIQSSTTKYFFVYGVSSNSINIAGGVSPNVYTNNTITSLSFSNRVSPSGFGSELEYLPIISKNSTGMANIAISTSDCHWWMIGSIVFVSLDVSYTYTTPPADYLTDIVELTSPFLIDNNKIEYFVIPGSEMGVGSVSMIYDSHGASPLQKFEAFNGVGTGSIMNSSSGMISATVNVIHNP